MSGDINLIEEDYSHFFKRTKMSTAAYRSYFSLYSEGNMCLEKHRVKCFSVGDKGCTPLKRVNFESIFLETPEEIKSVSLDPYQEFQKRLDKKFYTSKFNLDPNLHTDHLFFHYFTDKFKSAKLTI